MKPATIRLAWPRPICFRETARRFVAGETLEDAIRAVAAVNGQPRGQTDPVWKNFSPRLGIAYELHPKLIMRAGYGIFFSGTTNAGRAPPVLNTAGIN